jgi:parvulin-like peptidyl-prolyl isomerase
VGAKPGQSKKSGRQRLALVVFGVLFVVLFAGYAIAQGLGHPSVPSGDVAIVTQVPDEIGSVSEADFKRALLQQAAQAKLKTPPKPGEDKYEELKTAALGELLDTIWIQGEAEELDISVTPKQIATELAQIKKTNFKTPAEYKKFLTTSHFTKADVLARVKLQLLSTQIQEAISKEAPAPSSAEISAYYDSAKETQYSTKESRDIRLVINRNKTQVEKAKALLDKDHSVANWKKVAAKYSSDPTTKSKGGLQPEISEESVQGALKKAIFESPTGEVKGPFSLQGNFFVVEVVKLNPAKVKPLAEVRAEISTQLTQQTQQAFFSEFVAEYQSKWQSRTFCASGFEIERCANFPSAKRIEKEREPYKSCYEADPKKAPKECPAPVVQAKPAMPGSVTILKPGGEPLPQRPRPEGLEESAAAGSVLPEGVTPGAAGAAPPSGE